MSFSKLTRTGLRSLKSGESRTEHGITYERLAGDGRWSINIMVNRQRHHVVVGLESQGFTRTQAEELIATLKAKKAERRHGIATKKAGAVSVKAALSLYMEHLRETGGKDITKKQQRIDLHLVPHLGGLTLGSMTETDLARYRTARRKEGAAAGTINRELAVVSHLFRLASDRQRLGLISSPPCRIEREKEPETKPVYLTPVQAKKLLDAAALDPNRHVHAFAMVGLHTGMRRESILRMRIEDIDLDRRVIWIDKDKAGERQQPMTAELAEYLREYVNTLPKASQWLFPSKRAAEGRAVNVYKAFKRVAKTAGLPASISPHKLRHTMATNAAHAGVDAPTLQAMGGWKSRRMVERYTHAGSMQDAMAKLQSAYKSDTITQELQDDSTQTA